MPRTVVALGVVSLLNDIGGDAIAPLLPAFIASIGAGPAALGIIEGVADATASSLQLVSGYLADRSGRLKALTLAGYGIANLLRPLLAIVNAPWQILVIRFGDRAGKGIRGAPRDALVAESAPAALRGTAYGIHRGFDHAGAIIGPALAYVMLSRGFSIRAVFASSVVPGALCLIVLALGVQGMARRPVIEIPTFGLPPSPIYRRFLLATLIFTLGNSSDSFLLWRARELGIPVAIAPLLWALLSMAKSASSFIGGRLSDWLGRRTAILAGWSVYALAYLGFAFAIASWQIWLLLAFCGLSYGLSESPQSALVVDLVDPDWRGRGLGAYNASIGLATLPASIIFGVLYQTVGARGAFGSGAALATIAMLVLPSARALRSAQMRGDRDPSARLSG